MSNNEVLELLKQEKVVNNNESLQVFKEQYLKISGINKNSNENITITCIDFITTVSEYRDTDYSKELEIAILKEIQRVLNKVSIHYTNKQDIKRTVFVKDMQLRESQIIEAGISKNSGKAYEEFLSPTKLNYFTNENSLELTLKVN